MHSFQFLLFDVSFFVASFSFHTYMNILPHQRCSTKRKNSNLLLFELKFWLIVYIVYLIQWLLPLY